MTAHTGLNSYVLRYRGEYVYRAGALTITGTDRGQAYCFLEEPELLEARMVEVRKRFPWADGVVVGEG